MDSNLKNKQDLNPLSVVKNLRLKNVNKTIIGQINIKSISSKFNQLKELVLKHVDILVVCETKLDETFPSSQFHLDGFSLPYRLDRNRNGGVMIFVKEDIPSKLLTKHNFPRDILRDIIYLLN